MTSSCGKPDDRPRLDIDDFSAAGLSNEWSRRLSNVREQLLVTCLTSKGFDVVAPDRSKWPMSTGEGRDRGWADDQYRLQHGLGVSDSMVHERAMGGYDGPRQVGVRGGEPDIAFETAAERCADVSDCQVATARHLWNQATSQSTAQLADLYASRAWLEAAERWRNDMGANGFEVTTPQRFVSDLYRTAFDRIDPHAREAPARIAELREYEMRLAAADVACRTELVSLLTEQWASLANGRVGSMVAALDAELGRLEQLGSC